MELTSSNTLKKDMLAALTASRGIVTEACENAGISRTTHYKWYKEDAEYKAEVDAIQDVALDFAEGKLFERMNGVLMGKKDKDGGVDTYELPPDNTSIIFYLKTKGKKRGYVERQEIQQEVQGDINIFLNGEAPTPTIDLYGDTNTASV